MIAEKELEGDETISFGPFSLVTDRRLLMKDGTPVELGARAFDILITLLSRPNEIVSKKDLLAKVWPKVSVEEGRLRFHITHLRKVLGDRKDGARYIETLPGRGYCFVAPISGPDVIHDESGRAAHHLSNANLPGPFLRMVGRDDDLLKLSNLLNAVRFVTIVGAGGIGKTTVAVAVAHRMSEEFAGPTLFVDMGTLSDPRLVTTSVASMLGLSVRSDDATPNLIAYLRDKPVLLILDTCEHLIDAVADLASQIIAAAPQVYVLATSREALQVEGEHVYKLDPLACPPDDDGLTTADALTFPAVQLFIDQAVASGARVSLSDAEVRIVVDICRKLDGVALAIELAARRVEAYGLSQTAALLDQRLTMLWLGRRTAPPRQKTMQATLDWSYGLLSELERIVLRRLAVFVGYFTLDAALAVVTKQEIDQSLAFDAIHSLVVKSMVATHTIGATIHYRLLDTTRAYALETSADAAELIDLRMRHAAYYRQSLDQTKAEWETLSTGADRLPVFASLNNARAALEWCFGVDGNAETAVKLAAAAVPVFLSMSLHIECRRWAEQAIGILDVATRGGIEEMHLQAALGLSLILADGGTESAHAAYSRGLTIAEERGDAVNQLKLLVMLKAYYLTIGDFKTTLTFVAPVSALAKSIADPAAIALAQSNAGMVLSHTGDLAGARVELEAALRNVPNSRRSSAVYLGFDGYVWAHIYLARTLWLQGYPDQAAEHAHQSIKHAVSTEHPVTLSIVLIRSITVFLWVGDLEMAEELLDWLSSHAEAHSMMPYLTAARGYKGVLAVRRGDATGGVTTLERALAELHSARYELLTAFLNISLAEGLAIAGQPTEAITLIEEATRKVEQSGELSYMPEMQRTRGSILLSMPHRDRGGAEKCFERSLMLSRQQGARAWELRAATDLAALWASQGRSADAKILLQPIFGQFAEGLQTPDLKKAERLLSTLS